MSHDKVALTVVRFLGAAALLFGVGLCFLVWSATQYEGIDPSTVALVGQVGALAGGAMGALGAILASTGKGSAPAGTPSDPVSVETAEKPLEVTPAVPAVVSPDPAAPEESDL